MQVEQLQLLRNHTQTDDKHEHWDGGETAETQGSGEVEQIPNTSLGEIASKKGAVTFSTDKLNDSSNNLSVLLCLKIQEVYV